ncbi:MAG: carbamoyltransferase HypF [Acidimicrobiales bacterium]
MTVTGLVQGVGFRPFVHRLAGELGLVGFVGNDSACVFIEVQGPEGSVERFVARLASEAPPLARVESVTTTIMAAGHDAAFRIAESSPASGPRTLVAPDVAVCADCMAEVLDPRDRRYRYPFTNCTNCGPRFTIIRDLPYDRPGTTMAGFGMCSACRSEYEDPADRRYHAQPIACPRCGPSISFERGEEVVRGTDRVLVELQRSVVAGQVVAVKGIGGYHLCCDATSDAPVERLRVRKGRLDKPFALMVPDLATARGLASIDGEEAAALESPARPIVLVRRRPDAPLSGLVAPGNPLIGLMLPYTPLHHLLFLPVPGSGSVPPHCLVLTSGNVSDEPICTDDAQARVRLHGLADGFLTNDRPIHVPCDDSVVRVVDGRVQPVRRSRGYAPLPVHLPVEVAPTLAVGGELKNTFCLASGRHAWVSQHLGDIENLETLDAFRRCVDGFRRMYGIAPTRWAADGHPGYLTRRWALENAGGVPVVDVQHHHAHLAAMMAEHGLDGSSPVLGFAFDGTGYGVGDDGRPEIWGGEALVADYRGFERAGHLRALPLPGGNAAVRNPCRVAVAYLAALGIDIERWLPAAAACDEVELGVVQRQVERNVGCVPTTSMGRLFDAVASLLGVRHRITYEAQAAIELEALAEHGALDPAAPRWSFAVDDDNVVDPGPVVRGLVAGLSSGAEPADLALGFHDAVARAVLEVAARLRPRYGSMPVALSGGVFQNTLLTRLTRVGLEHEGFEVLTHRLVPPNDGGLSLGQAIIAGHGGG